MINLKQNEKAYTSLSLGSAPSYYVVALATDALLMLLHHTPLLKKNMSSFSWLLCYYY
jgi:hypothetical protein